MRKLRHSRRAALAVTVTFGLILSACSGGDQSAQEGVGGTGSTPDVAQVEPVYSVLRIAVSSFGNESLDPATENRLNNLSMNFLMFDTLTDIGPDGELVPGVATDWTLAADGLTWEFKLRSDVVFHDGTPMTAADVKFSIERMQNEEASAASATIARRTIAAVDVVDDYTVRITTTGPSPDLPMILSPHSSEFPILSRDYLLGSAGDSFAAQSELMRSAPVGSGPFRFSARVPGDSFTFTAVEEHWRTTPEVDEVQFLLVPEASTQVAMLRTGEVDLIQAGSDDARSLEADGFRTYRVAGATQVSVFFLGTYRPPGQNKPTADARVRRALSLAINRQELIDAFEGGEADLLTTPWNTLPSTLGIDERRFSGWAAEANRYSTAESRSLLAEAGFANGFSGATFHTFVIAGLDYLPDLAQAIVEQWRQVGVTASLSSTDYGTFRPHFIRAPLDDAYNAADPNTFANAPRFLASEALTVHYRFEGGSAQFLKSDDMDALLAAIEAETDAGRRQSLINQAFDAAHAEWLILPLYQAPIRYVANPEVLTDLPTIDGWAFFSRVIERATTR
jgi:peptide/nickel transport system substrate-binding protein